MARNIADCFVEKANKTIMFLFIFLFCTFGATSVFAWPPTYSSEFNFTSVDLYRHWKSRKELEWFKLSQAGVKPDRAEQQAVDSFRDAVVRACSECRVTSSNGKFGMTEHRVTFPDGWFFDITVDSVMVEIKLKPSTLSELKNQRSRINQFIFQVAKEQGLSAEKTPFYTRPTAHFNLGAKSAFDDDPKAFTRYFVDEANHAELGFGVLGYEDLTNAPPLTHRRKGQRDRLAAIVDDVNHDRVKDLSEAAKRIQVEVYQGQDHYQAMGLKYLNMPGFPEEDRPIETRGTKQPLSAEEFELFVEMKEERLKYLHDLKEPIVYQGKGLETLSRKIGSKELMSAGEKASRFYIYLAETGLPWEKFKTLALPEVQAAELDAFVTGKVDWGSPISVAEISRYVDDVASSPWVRQRMLKLIQDPAAHQSKDGTELLTKLAQKSGKWTFPEKMLYLKHVPEPAVTPNNASPQAKLGCLKRIMLPFIRGR